MSDNPISCIKISPSIPYYRGLALEGGGVCGIAHVGVLDYLYSRDLIKNIDYIIGSSAGSIVALLLAIKIPVPEIKTILNGLDMSRFEDPWYDGITDLSRLIHRLGWNPGDHIINFLENILYDHIKCKDITLDEIYTRFGVNLIITSTCYSIEKTIYYDRFKYPHKSVVKAIRESTALPIIFEPVILPLSELSPMDRPPGITHMKQPLLFLDGGVLNNYPIRYLYQYISPHECIGVMLINKNDPVYKPCAYSDTPTLFEYIGILIKILHDQNIKINVNEADLKRTIIVNCGDISCTQFNITVPQKEQLYNSGYQSAKKFLKSVI